MRGQGTILLLVGVGSPGGRRDVLHASLPERLARFSVETLGIRLLRALTQLGFPGLDRSGIHLGIGLCGLSEGGAGREDGREGDESEAGRQDHEAALVLNGEGLATSARLAERDMNNRDRWDHYILAAKTIA